MNQIKRKKINEEDLPSVMIIKKKHKFPKKMVKYVDNIVKDMQKRLGFVEYQIKVNFVETDFEDKFSVQSASIMIDHVYLTANIFIRPTMRDDWEFEEYKQICNFLIHELSHIFLEPISVVVAEHMPNGINNKTLQEEVERQVQRIANSIQKILPKDYHKPSNWTSISKSKKRKKSKK